MSEKHKHELRKVMCNYCGVSCSLSSSCVVALFVAAISANFRRVYVSALRLLSALSVIRSLAPGDTKSFTQTICSRNSQLEIVVSRIARRSTVTILNAQNNLY